MHVLTTSPSARTVPAVAPAPADLEYTSDALAGCYAPVRSWTQLDALAARVESLSWRWVVVQRRDDPGQRFAQCIRVSEGIIVEVGALDPSRSRHTVWRLHADDREGRPPGPPQFLDIARDWLVLGVVPGFTASTLPLDNDGSVDGDEPF